MKKFVLCCFVFVELCAGFSWAADRNRTRRIDRALKKATDYILSKQSDDGAWRSETYGCFREDPALTPYIMSGLAFVPSDAVRKSYRRGVDYLVKIISDGGEEGPEGLNFPVYTAACAGRVVVLEERSDRNIAAQKAWLEYLRKYQFSRSLGWAKEDMAFGGWGFSMRPPVKVDNWQDNPFMRSNLTASVFGIAAFRSGKVSSDDPLWEDALVFVKRCQNFSEDSSKSDERFDDGGFYFCPGDGLQNKAGIAGVDRHGKERYHSYGSMTGDGVRALLGCGLPPDHPRVLAGIRWLERNFSSKQNPGEFASDREVLRQATYYYYLWSVAHAFTRLGIRTAETKNGNLDWAEVLADELISQQRADGTWINRYTDAKEDDPLVATPWAAAVLANCRYVLTTPGDLRMTRCPGFGEKVNDK